MMEKYGTDMNDLPATKEQIEILKKLIEKTGKELKVPQNRKQADELIEKLSKG